MTANANDMNQDQIMAIMTIFLDLKQTTGCEARRSQNSTAVLPSRTRTMQIDTNGTKPLHKQSTFTGFKKTLMEPLTNNPLSKHFKSFLQAQE